MRPILFDKNTTNFTTNGIGRLTPISCSVTEERNGIFELEMVVKLGCDHFSGIKHSYIIVAKPSPSRNPQPFRIYSVSRPINGKVKVKAQHLSYWLNYIPVMPFSAQSASSALNGFKTNAAESCPFSFWTDISSNSSYAVAAPESIRHYLGGVRGSILDVYGGEYEWDGFTVKLHRARGRDRGVVFRYGKNITDLRQEENIANTFTGICPYWLSTEGQMVTLPEKVVRSSNASNFPFQRTIVKDFSDKFDNAPTVAQLRTYSQSYVSVSGIGVPSVSIEVNPVDISQTEEYKDSGLFQTLELCDTVKVEFSTLGVSTTAKLTKTVYDVLSERYTKLGIGDVRSSLARTIEEQIDTISYMPTTTEMHRNIDRATGVLNSGLRGYVIINRNVGGWANEILFLDNENIAQAKNVLRINNAGIGFSSTGYRGPYYQSWTIDGHFALGGVNNAYGDFEILGADGKPLGEWDKDGLRLYGTAQEILLSITTGGFFLHGNNGKKLVELNHSGLYLYADDGQRVLAQMTNKGLGIYEGEIDLKWNGETGIYFKASETEGDSDTLQIGDFIVSTDYGRQIWESSDEMTGMSGEPDDYGGYFLWAGWRSDDDFAFVVEDQGGGGNDNVVIRGHLIVNDVDILDYVRNISIDDDDDDDGDGGDPDPTGGEYDPGEDSGGTGPGYQGVNVNFDALVDYYSKPSGPASDPDLGGG